MKSFVKSVSLTVFLMFLCGLSICLAQQDNTNKLVLKKGKLLSEENTATSIGEIQIIQYRLEQVELTKPLNRGNDMLPLESVFRIVIVTAKPLPFDDYSVWVDDNQKDAYPIKPNEFAVIVYAETLSNGTIKLALSKRSETNREARSVLTGTLSVPSEYATPLEKIEANRLIIKLRRFEIQTYRRIELRIENFGGRCSALRARNYPLILEIGGADFGIGCDGDDVVVVRFSIENFARLRDGAEIAFMFGDDIRSRRVVGRLDKSLLR